ncbi:hypothetical protein [Nitrosospira briensis]|uniref:hypothetical protein n=1 Tax=Nitrosospira briensis TaxID=35799 RepID=UPI0008ED32B1|nr:hypothetical protein [Nitrosospira briensis]SFO23780.1 hypothetical protein SAMN05216332_108100 [Nitrosospira briensis]
MDVYRRNLMKGALMGSTLLTLGIPPITMAAASAGKPGRLRLLLGSGAADAEFAAGARTAFAGNARRTATGHDATTGTAQDGLQVIKLKDGLLNEYEEVAHLLATFRDTRWIAVMDDGSAAVFTELVRNAGGSLLSLGSHASSVDTWVRGMGARVPTLRHVWAAASPSHAAGSILAARLVESERSFSIVESFFSTQGTEERGTVRESPPGFLAWRLDGAGPGPRHDPAHLYCAGVSPADGCKLLGWDAAPAWTPVNQEPGLQTASHGKRRSARASDESYAGGWMEAVGYAVVAAALGADAGYDSCSVRAHVYQSDEVKRGAPSPCKTGGFTSFVVDI